MVWALCVDGDTLNAVMEQFAIKQELVKARVAEALETLAAGYEG